MNKGFKKIFSTIIALSMLLSTFGTPNVVYAAAATASGTASVKNAVLYKDGTATVNLSITGTQASLSKSVPNDIVIIADNSGSMSTNDRIGALKNAVKQFASTVSLTKHRIGIVAFDSSVMTMPFSTDKNALCSYADKMSAGGGTYVGPAIDAAVTMLKNDKRPEAKPTIIILTDGDASDSAAMLAAAERAKNEGFVFYTIALLDDTSDPDHNSINNQLKKLATTEAHHHFVGVENLEELYSTLADYVGVENPYNVEIKQKIADEFEYVPGSADKNIPVPTINGNTLTWNMLEIKNTTIKLSYKIRPKDSSMEDGRYKVCTTSYLTYEDYAGAQFKKAITSPYIDVKPYADPTVTGMSPTSSDEGKETIVRINLANMVYEDDMKVLMNGKAVKISYVGSSYCKFVVPSDMPAGIYTVNIFNHGRTVNVGTYEVKEVVLPEPSMSKISVKSGKEGTTVTERINISNLEYADDFAVYVDGKEANISYKGSAYYKFEISKKLAPGDYACTAVNNGISYDLGVFTFEEVPIPEVTFGKLPITSGKEGETPIERINVSTAPEYSKLTVTVDGKDCPLTYKSSSYFKFAIPDGLTPGTYEVVVKHGADTVLGNYEVKADIVPEPSMSEINVKSGKEGTTVTEKINIANLDYADDFTVYVDGKEANISYKGAAYYKFEISKKLAPGDYECAAVNDGITYPLGTYTVTEIPIPDITFSKLPTTSGKEGESLIERINVSAEPIYSKLKVMVGDVECPLTYKSSLYFKFEIPVDLAPGTYDVVVNHGNDILLGNYTVEAVPEVVPEFSELPIKSGETGTSPVERIDYTNMGDFADDFAVLVGTESANISYKNGTYFKFDIPATLPIGTYEIKVINNGKEYILGGYEVKETHIDMFKYSKPTKSGTIIRVNATGVDFSGLKVYVGGTEVPLTYKSSSYFKVDAKGCSGALTVDYFTNTGVDMGFTY